MTRERVFESREQVSSLFTQGRKITANTAKDSDSGVGAKTSGDFLLHLDHAQVPLGLIVVEGHCKIGHEGQNLPLVPREPIKQVASGILFGSTSMDFLWGRRRRVGSISLVDQGVIAAMKSAQSQHIQFVLVGLSCLLHRLLHVQKQVFHFSGPGLLKHFLNEGQFSQMMDIAQSMTTRVALIAHQPIMHARPRELRQDPNGCQRFTSSFWMGSVMGQVIGRADMNPLPRFANPQSSAHPGGSLGPGSGPP